VLLTGHANAEEAVIYPALVHFGHKSHAMTGYTEQAGAKANLGELEYLDPMGQDYLDKLEHIRGAVVHHMYEEESDRFLDLKLRLPEGFDLYELRLRQVVRERIHRGHVDVHVGVEPGAAMPIHVNRELVQAYLKAADDLRLQTAVTAELDVVALLRLPGVIGGLAPAVPESAEEQEQLGGMLDKCLLEALGKLDEMRRAEGRHLVEDLRGRLARIGELAEQVRGLVSTLRPAFARRLDARLKDMLGSTALDPARLAQEAAILAERSDISEELDRLRSHLQQFGKLLDGAGELGKKLDFLLQEIKAEIEKLREQVQNIE